MGEEDAATHLAVGLGVSTDTEITGGLDADASGLPGL